MNALLDSLVVYMSVRLYGVVFEIDFLKLVASLKVVQVVNRFYVIPFKVKNLQVLEEANIKEIVDIVVCNVQLFQLGKGLYPLDFAQFTPS